MQNSLPNSSASEKSWSATLKEQTAEAIGKNRFNPITGKLHLKHIASKYGTIEAVDLASNHLAVTDLETSSIQVFADAEELISAGWAID